MVDVISRAAWIWLYQGRSYEFACSNQNAVALWTGSGRRRTYHSGDDQPRRPLHWESENSTIAKSISGRALQAPHPPVWSSEHDSERATRSALLGGKRVRDGGARVQAMTPGPCMYAYRDRIQSKRVAATAPADRLLAISVLVSPFAATERKARERAEIIAAYLRSSAIVAPAFRNPPDISRSRTTAPA